MKFVILALFLATSLFSTGVHADFEDWTLQNQRLYASSLTMHAMDVMQTFALIECQQTNPYCPYYERNKLLGTHPSKGAVILTSLTFELLNYRILNNERLSSRKRRNALILMNSLAVIPIINNEMIGLGIYVPIIPYRHFINK